MVCTYPALKHMKQFYFMSLNYAAGDIIPVIKKDFRKLKIENLIARTNKVSKLPSTYDLRLVQIIEQNEKFYVLRGLEHLVLATQEGIEIVEVMVLKYDSLSLKYLLYRFKNTFTPLTEFIQTKEIEEIKGVEEVMKSNEEISQAIKEKENLEPEECIPQTGGESITECMKICAETGQCSSEECYRACLEYFTTRPK